MATTREQVNFAVDEELRKLMDERLPRVFNLSIFLRWCVRSLVMDKKELEQACWKNEQEAADVAPFLQQSLRRIFECMPQEKLVEKKPAVQKSRVKNVRKAQ